jgi:hypothetical protein
VQEVSAIKAALDHDVEKGTEESEEKQTSRSNQQQKERHFSLSVTQLLRRQGDSQRNSTTCCP